MNFENRDPFFKKIGSRPEEIKIQDVARGNQSSLSLVDPKSRDDVSSYYQFEIDQGFSKVNPKTTFEKMIDFRQQQIRDGKLKVLMAKGGDQVIATAVVVLENGTMGKKLNQDEAWAAGTVVDKTIQGLGIGEKIAREEDKIALEAGKKYILTIITNDNFSSMRVYMKIGYQLEGIDKREEETNYIYRKNLLETQPQIDWQTAMGENPVIFEGKIDESTPDRILIDPNNDQAVQQALDNNYRGIHLLTPKDLRNPDKIDRNLIVFAKR